MPPKHFRTASATSLDASQDDVPPSLFSSSSSSSSFSSSSSSSSATADGNEVDIFGHRLESHCSGGTQGGFRTTFSSGQRHTRVTVQTSGYGVTYSRKRLVTSTPGPDLMPRSSQSHEKGRSGGGVGKANFMEHQVGDPTGGPYPAVAGIVRITPTAAVNVSPPPVTVSATTAAVAPLSVSSSTTTSKAATLPILSAPSSSPPPERSTPIKLTGRGQGEDSSQPREAAGQLDTHAGVSSSRAMVGPSSHSLPAKHSPSSTGTPTSYGSTPPPPSARIGAATPTSASTFPASFSPSPLFFGAAGRFSAGSGPSASSTSGNTKAGGGKSGGGGGGGTLRYRTDLNKVVLHFMMERMISSDDVRKIEEISFSGKDSDKDRDWHFFWMSVSRIRSLFQSSPNIIENRLASNNIINHFPNHYELTRKDLMYKNIKVYIRAATTNAAAREMTSSPAAMIAGGTIPTATNMSSTSGGGGGKGGGGGGALDDGPSDKAAKEGISVMTTIPSKMSNADAYTVTCSVMASVSSSDASSEGHGTAKQGGAASMAEQEGAQFSSSVHETVTHSIFFQPSSFHVNGAAGSEPNSLVLSVPIAMNWQAAASFAGAAASLSPYERQQRLAELFSFADSVPISYQMPTDMSTFIDEFKKNTGVTWIVKPTSRCQGRGIFLVNKLPKFLKWAKEKKDMEPQASYGSFIGSSSQSTANSNASDSLSSFIVSKYISDPLLIGGRKFDLRLYVLVTSFRPLVAYLHECGFARFCATKYKSKCATEEDLCSHLTNVALQKGEKEYNKTHGGKWLVRQLLLYVECRYGPYKAEGLWSKVKFLLFHSLLSVKNVIFNDKHCFELYGYDILIDNNLNPHLIEVNASPSLTTTTTTDRLIKEEVLADTMRIVIPPGFASVSASNANGGVGEYHFYTPNSNNNNMNSNTNVSNTDNSGSSGAFGGGSGNGTFNFSGKPWLYGEHRLRSDVAVTLGTGFSLL